jgi:hypothetical protein
MMAFGNKTRKRKEVTPATIRGDELGYIEGGEDVEIGPSSVANETRSAEKLQTDVEETEPTTTTNPATTRKVQTRSVILPKKTFLFCGLVVVLGCAAAAAFISIGLIGARKEQDEQFNRRSSEVVISIGTTWNAYEFIGLHTHNICRKGVTRREFRELYEHLNSTDLVFQSAVWLPNVTHDQRATLEAEAKEFYAEFYPEVDYSGFAGMEYDPNTPVGFVVRQRSNQSFYFPGHFVEPVMENLGQLDYDLFSGPSVYSRASLEASLSSWKPTLSPPLRISRDRASGQRIFSVILMHPGVPLSTVTDQAARDIAAVVIRIPDFLVDLSTKMVESAQVYLYDSTNPNIPPVFLGGASMVVGNNGKVVAEHKESIPLADLLASSTTKEGTSEIAIAQRKWTVAIVAVEGTYETGLFFIVLGGAIIFACCVCLAIWLYTSILRHTQMILMEDAAKAEKNEIVVENAKESARAERDLNDFIAHEVRNPLSAAMSACSFVAAALNDGAASLVSREERQPILEDIQIIEASCHFINDFLRNMLDMQRASSNQLHIEFSPTDLISDVLMPVDTLLYRRDSPFEVQVLCPDNLVVSTDRLRLKQIVLNVSRYQMMSTYLCKHVIITLPDSLFVAV